MKGCRRFACERCRARGRLTAVRRGMSRLSRPARAPGRRAPPPAAPAPEGWEAHWSKTCQRHYLWSPTTNEVRWPAASGPTSSAAEGAGAEGGSAAGATAGAEAATAASTVFKLNWSSHYGPPQKLWLRRGNPHQSPGGGPGAPTTPIRRGETRRGIAGTSLRIGPARSTKSCGASPAAEARGCPRGWNLCPVPVILQHHDE